ncbi:MAG: hypothetical protein K8L99_10090, partial [Anaerolineae bacterium]|nr:hypothetical protein [Anaerolineae bacterium]
VMTQGSPINATSPPPTPTITPLQNLLDRATNRIGALGALITQLSGLRDYTLIRYDDFGSSGLNALGGTYFSSEDKYGIADIPKGEVATFTIDFGSIPFLTDRIECFYSAKPATMNTGVPASTLTATVNDQNVELARRRISVSNSGAEINGSLLWSANLPRVVSNITFTFNVRGRQAGDGYVYCDRIEIHGYGDPPLVVEP